jgi:hypothetical protein
VGTFGLPADSVALGALVVALVVLVLGLSPFGRRMVSTLLAHSRATILGLSVVAFALSLGYLAYYLRGGPRIIDATAYFYQAKVFASGHLTLAELAPGASFRGRFEYTSPTTLVTSVLFPPGYPALLALGVLLHAPLVVGPLLATGLVLGTAALARRIWGRDDVAVVAAVLSVVCAALRYHTADTMSHGWAALLFVLSLFTVLGARPSSRLLSGLLLGWLIATRPVTGGVATLVATALLLSQKRSLRDMVPLGLGLLPGIFGLMWYQHAAVGAWFGSTQLFYYRVADGPPGCFRYGFGGGIGCLFEHGDYVRARLPNGYGILQAAWVSLLRLRWHALDVHNFELLFVVTIVAGYRALRHPTGKFLVLGALGLVLCYAPFYFDGSYPGGGARLYAEALPLEHVWVAAWLVEVRRFLWFLPVSLGGFACHAVYEHQVLSLRDGGRPMFEENVLDGLRDKPALVFVDTDHGFFLGNQPFWHQASRNSTVAGAVASGPLIARFRGDANDRILFDRLGAPPTYYYRFQFGKGLTKPRLEEYRPHRTEGVWHFEAESSWPPLAVPQGWIEPVYPSNDCTSSQRALQFHPEGGRAAAILSLTVPVHGNYKITMGWVAVTVGRYRAQVQIGGRTHLVSGEAVPLRCFSTEIPPQLLAQGEHRMTISVEEGELALDSMELAVVPPSMVQIP